MFWDSHAHQMGEQQGGFIIALENGDKNVISNSELRNLQVSSNFVLVEYITREFQATVTDVVKYHPRLEGYNPDEVTADIIKRKPKGVIFDTLNEPHWHAIDYWQIANKFPQIQFLFSHAGGYEILEFIKICDFTKNVWLDFSFTQNYFGLFGEKAELKLITDCIRYAFVTDRISGRVLFGSDYPYESQKECIEYYIKNANKNIYLDNFQILIHKLFD